MYLKKLALAEKGADRFWSEEIIPISVQDPTITQSVQVSSFHFYPCQEMIVVQYYPRQGCGVLIFKR